MERNKHSGDIDELKRGYELLRSKYGLPEFKFLNENFEIEDLSDTETDLLLRKIRKQMFEKINGVMRMLETFTNPSNAPMFLLNIMKGFGEDEKKTIEAIYKQLTPYAVDSFNLEIRYNEKKEADMINKISGDWPKLCEGMDKIYLSMKSGSEKEAGKKEKSYFG